MALVLVISFGCGSDKNKAGGDGRNNGPGGNNNNLPLQCINQQCTQNMALVVSAISNQQFAQPMGWSGETYDYIDQQSWNFNDSCEEYWGFFTFCDNNNNSSSNNVSFKRFYNGGNSFNHNEVGNPTSSAAIASYLVNEVSLAISYYQDISGTYLFQMADQSIVGIDFNRPIGANPVFYRASNGSGYQHAYTWLYNNP